MDKAVEADPAKAGEPSAGGGGRPAPEPDKPVADGKGRPGTATTGDGKVPDTTVHVRPTPPQGNSSWSPSGGPPPPPPAGLSSPSQDSRKPASDNSPRTPRKAHLVLRRVEPWSAMKFSFVVSLVCFVVLFVAVAVLYMVLNSLGVFDSIIQTVNQFTVSDGKPSANGFNVASWFEPVRILGYTALIGAVNVVLITALSTLGAVIYNIASDLVGGIEVTFSEAE
ncbi:DUF3566 domain-containing protein [Streptosporangium sp. NPDC020145]|uniref:DUF3566 domain-containing protein n=1 Tax=Streptosporangium sp. NPDC020145 TaxID=3154694 RepID=UPI0034474ACC